MANDKFMIKVDGKLVHVSNEKGETIKNAFSATEVAEYINTWSGGGGLIGVDDDFEDMVVTATMLMHDKCGEIEVRFDNRYKRGEDSYTIEVIKVTI